MPLAPGSRFGPYEIVAPLGAGGMGEVYKATDTRLSRVVALKVIPEELSAHGPARERFLREARAISSLTHPHICALYDVGTENGRDYLVMEYLEGTTLAERLVRGALPRSEAVRVATEIASALSAAHAAGIVHRDLKPANVMLTSNGAKLLDFGLAKDAEVSSGAEAPTQQQLTAPGTVVGTLHYMSPEQLSGAKLDSRSDIFSLGVLLYEMLTGKRPFEGKTRTAISISILESDPPPLDTPSGALDARYEHVVKRALQKSPQRRWQTAVDFAEELRWIATGASAPVATSTPKHDRSRALVIALAIAGAAAGGAWLAWRMRPEPARTVAFGIEAPPAAALQLRATVPTLALSPSGERLAFVAMKRGTPYIYVRDLGAMTANQLAGTEGASAPFWSPDEKWIGFFRGGELKKIPASGGTVQRICSSAGGSASWNQKDEIIYGEVGRGTSDAILLVPASGGQPRAITSDKGWHYWPRFLPDGKHFTFAIIGKPEHKPGLYLGEVGSDRAVLLSTTGSRIDIDSHDFAHYVVDGALVRQKIDIGKARLLGEPQTLAEPVFAYDFTRAAEFTVAGDGSRLAFLRATTPTKLSWKDRNGRALGDVLAPSTVRRYTLSPSETRIVLDRANDKSQSQDVWLHDVQRGVTSRITSADSLTAAPVMVGEQSFIGVALDRAGSSKPPVISLVSLRDGVAQGVVPQTGVAYPTDVSADGRLLLFTWTDREQSDVDVMDRATGQRRSLIRTSANDRDAVLSPDGKWVAFVSEESGPPDVYVMPFNGGEKTRVSVAGGIEPRWNARGDELYFIDPSGILMSTSFDASGTPGRQQPMFGINSTHTTDVDEFGQTHYLPSRDGQRFLVRELPAEGDSSPIRIIMRD